MNAVPETRITLIARLANANDADAWKQFADLYSQAVYRLARKVGLQHADAEELVQEVLLAVARNVERWSPDETRGRFRDWMFRIARNLSINLLTRKNWKTLASGNSEMLRQILDCRDQAAEWGEAIDLEFRRSVFLRAADKVKADVARDTWQAFWITSVDGVSVSEASSRLKISAGAIYVARSRVMAKLRDEVRALLLAEES